MHLVCDAAPGPEHQNLLLPHMRVMQHRPLVFRTRCPNARMLWSYAMHMCTATGHYLTREPARGRASPRSALTRSDAIVRSVWFTRHAHESLSSK